MKLGKFKIYFFLIIFLLGSTQNIFGIDKIDSVPLVNLEELSPDLQEKWKVYLKNQLKHQMMQEEFAVKAKKEVKEKLLAMKEADCSKLNRDANVLGDSIVQKYGESRDAYNKKTDHGVKNGAVFR